MCRGEDVVTLWCLIEAPAGVWAGDGEWPMPKSAEEENHLTMVIQLALMSAIISTVKGKERYSLTLLLTNISSRPIQWALRQNVDLRRGVEENAPQIAWKEWGPYLG